MGIRKIYTCDGEGCRATEEFGSSTSLKDLGSGRWLIKPPIGGCAVYCPKCRKEHDRLKIKEELITNRHQQQAQKEIQDLHIKGLKPLKEIPIREVSIDTAKKLLKNL